MKIRAGFVSNSSSCSFMIYNNTDKTLTLEDFVKENPQLVEDFKNGYGYEDNPNFNQTKMLKNAKERNQKFRPGQNLVTFGDEDGDILGHVFDYELRDGGKSKSFRWEFHAYCR